MNFLNTVLLQKVF